MEHPPDFEKMINTLKSVVWAGNLPAEDERKLSDELDSILTVENGVRHLRQYPKDFEVMLSLFIRTIFHSNREVAQPCLKHCDLVLDIFRSTLPKIRASYKDFEKNTLLGLVDSLKPRVEANDDSWTTIWVFVCNLLTCDNLQAASLNKLLAITEHAYKYKGKCRPEVIEKAWICWRGLIKAFDRNPKCINVNKTINLLLRPLINLSSTSKSQISTWIPLIEAKGLTGSEEIIKSVVGSMCKMMYNSGDRSLSRHSPDECIDALIKIFPQEHVSQYCLHEIIDVFGACVSSRPSAGLIEQFAGMLILTINECKDDGASFKLWKALLEQYDACAESPILTQACQNIFTDVNFCRWVETRTIEGKDIIVLMANNEFRDKVLLRAFKALAVDEQVGTPTKRKSRKGSCEDVWSNYCEAYVTWWSNQTSPSVKENDKPEAIQSLKDSCDYQAVQFLLLHPIQLNKWNATVSKTWSLLCATCYNKKFLHTLVKAIFDAVCENFQVQKAIDVSDCLYKLDNSFCKQSVKVLDTISSAISSMEFQNLLDVLNLLETAVLFPEMAVVLAQVCKNAIEKSSDYDQLNAHKIRTKVSKITRKLELSNSAEKEKPAKVQRTPFRAQSNFLQRLAKAEEKNKTKSPFLTSMFSSSEKVKNGLENGEEQDENLIVDSRQENGVNGGVTTNGNTDDSGIVPLSPTVRGSPAKANGHTEEVAADKEMVLTIMNPSPVASPKIKITNAREVKIVDASSPALGKKHKPKAGLKTTPKKVTPSKVSYFDDDANDYVMVPPKPKTTPLTVHQMEMMSKRRTDIPALYQDLSQDTQSQQVADIQEMTTGVSPKPQESQDIVPGTPSPADRVTTPERRKSVGKSATSAKKLDFNNLCTPPSKTTQMNGALREMSPIPDDPKSCDELSNGIESQLAELKHDAPLVNGQSGSKKAQSDPKETDCVENEPQPATEEKSKRKRKSEPTKFSPKLTRSKRNLKSATPDAKLTKLLEPELQAQLRAKSPEPGAKTRQKSLLPDPESTAQLRAKSPEPVAKVRQKSSDPESNAQLRAKSPEPGAKTRQKSPELDLKAQLRAKSPEPGAKTRQKSPEPDSEAQLRAKSPEPGAKTRQDSPEPESKAQLRAKSPEPVAKTRQKSPEPDSEAQLRAKSPEPGAKTRQKSPQPELKAQLRAKSPEPGAKTRQKSPEPESKAQLRAKSPEPGAKTRQKSPEPVSNAQLRAKSPQPGAKTRQKSPEPVSKAQLRAKSPVPGAKTRPKSPELSAEIAKLPTANNDIIQSFPELPREIYVDVADNTDSAPKAKNGDDLPKCNGLQESSELSSQIAEVLPSSQSAKVPELSQEKPKKARKRKVTDSTHNETPKKAKTLEDEPKKSDSTKKKKPFKLGGGGNLENWLLKTERVPAPVPEPEIKIDKMETGEVEAEQKKDEFLPNGTDLDNSDEIVPSTQDIVEKNYHPILPVETQKEERCEEIVDEMGKEKLVVDSIVKDKNNTVLPAETIAKECCEEVVVDVSPSKRQKRAPSVFRGEGDTYLSKEKFFSEEPDEESKSSKGKKLSPSSKKRLHPLGGRSAKMLRLATSTSSNSQEDKDDIVVTPTRRRESIAPVRYGENWPKGHKEDWVAYTPSSPYVSPFRSALKKTPGPEEMTTPVRGRNDMASPLVSSAKRKRVVFLDPPVTQGLLYDLENSGGSVHHADVPPGSPYPTWKSEDDKMEISPSKRDALRLNSLAEPNSLKDSSPSKCKMPARHPCTSSDVSDEVRQLISPSEPTIVPTPALNTDELREKFNLSDEFMMEFSENDSHLQSLITQCFQCTNMKKTVGAFKFEDCILLNRMRKSFLESVRNVNGETVSAELNSFNQRPESSDCSAQTDEQGTSDTTLQPAVENSACQTNTTTFKSAETNTETSSTSSSTQADFRLPNLDELPSLVKKLTPTQFGQFITDFSRTWTSSLPE